MFNWGCLLTTVFMGVCAFLVGDTGLLALRLASGIGSALIVVCGGVLAARLASEHPKDGGLLLGIYYGGTGWGVVMSSVLVPLALTTRLHGWQSAWLALAIGCAVFSVGAIWAARKIAHAADGGGAVRAPSRMLSILKPRQVAAAYRPPIQVCPRRARNLPPTYTLASKVMRVATVRMPGLALHGRSPVTVCSASVISAT